MNEVIAALPQPLRAAYQRASTEALIAKLKYEQVRKPMERVIRIAC